MMSADNDDKQRSYSISQVSMEFRDKDKAIWLVRENGSVENYKLK